MFEAVILGYGLNVVIPGRVGELARAAILSMRERIPLEVSLGSVFADRFMDILAVLILFAGGVAVTGYRPDFGGAGSGILLALVIVSALLLLIVVVGRLLRRSRFGSSSVPPGWLARKIVALSRGVDAVHSPRLLPLILLQSLTAWFLIGKGVWVGLQGCGVEIPLMGAFVLLPLLVVGFAVPTPAGAGSYHAAMAFGLVTLFAVDKSQAAAASVLIDLVTVLPVLLLAVLLAVRRRVSLGSLIALIRESGSS